MVLSGLTMSIPVSISRLLLILLIVLLLGAKVFASEPEGLPEDPEHSTASSQGPAVSEPMTAPLQQGINPTASAPAPYQAGGSATITPRPPPPGPSFFIEPRRAESNSSSTVPPWLEEVRAQRHALREQRRAAHHARQEALDPIGTAQRDERKELHRRRQEEMRERIETERRLYLNQGPWFAPLIPRPPPAELDPLARGSLSRQDSTRGEQPSHGGDRRAPSDWNNLWYYNGW